MSSSQRSFKPKSRQEVALLDEENMRRSKYRAAMYRALVDNIVRLRNERTISQSQLGRATGIGHQRISLIEIRRMRPTDSMIVKIAEYFNVRVGELYRPIP